MTMKVTSVRDLNRSDYIIMFAIGIIYTLIYAISIISRVESVEFMAIDPHSIVDSLHTLTTYPYYNMGDSYHSKYYGWTFFSINFVVIMFSKLFGLVSDESFNIIVRLNLFIIGLVLTFSLYTLSRHFFSKLISSFAVVYFLFDPVPSHYFLTIHPESLGMLLQCVGLIVLLDITKRKSFPNKKFILAVVLFSLSSLAKQPFFIVNSFIGTVFICWAYKNFNLTSKDVIRLISYSVITFIVTFFVIHPYAFINFSAFIKAQSELSSGHSSVDLMVALGIWSYEISNSLIFFLNGCILICILFYRRLNWVYYCSVTLTILCACIFAYKARTFISLLYLYPLYIVAIFNIIYFTKSVISRITSLTIKRLILSISLLFVSFNASSNLAYSVFSSHFRYFTDGLGTKYATWDYIKTLNRDVVVAYSPDVAMPEPYKSNGCHAWQGCDGYDSLSKLVPDVVVLSPDYPHFNFVEYNKYVTENDYELVRLVEPDFSLDAYTCSNGLRFGIGRVNNDSLLSFNFIKPEGLASNILTCIDNYRFMIDNYNNNSISGLPKYVYRKY